MELSYEELMEGINSGAIDKVRFSVSIYPHYRNCCLERIYRDQDGIHSFECIHLSLTNDKSEDSFYHGSFLDKYKLFKIKGKGAFSLKEIYRYVEILEVIRPQ